MAISCGAHAGSGDGYCQHNKENKKASQDKNPLINAIGAVWWKRPPPLFYMIRAIKIFRNEVNSINLTRSHLYYLKKAKNRKAHLLSAQISREYRSPIREIYVRMIKRYMSLTLNRQFGIHRLEEMEDILFSQYLEAIKGYSFLYGGKLYE